VHQLLYAGIVGLYSVLGSFYSLQVADLLVEMVVKLVLTLLEFICGWLPSVLFKLSH